MNVKEYISSGIVESYVMGMASEAERAEFEAMCAQYSEIADARNAFELALEEQLLNDSAQAPQFLQLQIKEKINSIDSEASTNELSEEVPVRRMGAWKWIAAACLILLAGSVYWALTTNKKYRDLQAKTRQLENQVQQSSAQITQMQDDIDKLKHPMMTATLKSSDNSRTFATVYWDTSASKDVYLLINNMPQPPSQKQYQLWAMLNGQPIDLGMIEVKQKRLLYRMRNVQNAQAFAITIEPKGGSEKPTSAPVAMSNL